MRMTKRTWFAWLVAVVVGLFAAGCQSCQDTSKPPPPPSGQKQGAVAPAPPAAEEDDDDDEVDEDALVLLAEGDEEDGPAPLRVKFFVESLLNEEMDDPKYTWDFGDGSPASHEASPTHVYTKPGSYTAVIRIVDAEGQLGWDEVEIEVEEP